MGTGFTITISIYKDNQAMSNAYLLLDINIVQ